MYRIERDIANGISAVVSSIWGAMNSVLVVVRKGIVSGWYKIDGPIDGAFEQRSTDDPTLASFLPMLLGMIMAILVKWVISPYFTSAKNLVMNTAELALEDKPAHALNGPTDFAYRVLAAPLIILGFVGFILAGTYRSLKGIYSHFAAAFDDWYDWKSPAESIPIFSRKALARLPGAIAGVCCAMVFGLFSSLFLFGLNFINAFEHGYHLNVEYAKVDTSSGYPILSYPLNFIANILGYPLGVFFRGMTEIFLGIKFILTHIFKQLVYTVFVLLESLGSGYSLVYRLDKSAIDTPAHIPGSPHKPLFLFAKILGIALGIPFGVLAFVAVQFVPAARYIGNKIVSLVGQFFEILFKFIYTLFVGFAKGFKAGYSLTLSEMSAPENIEGTPYTVFYYPMAVFGMPVGAICLGVKLVAVQLYNGMAWAFTHIANAIVKFSAACAQATYHEFHSLNNHFRDEEVSLDNRTYPLMLGSPGALVGVLTASAGIVFYHFPKQTLISLFSTLGSFVNVGLERGIFDGVDGPNRRTPQKALGGLGFLVGYPFGAALGGGLYLARKLTAMAATIAYAALSFVAIVIIKDLLWHTIILKGLCRYKEEDLESPVCDQAANKPQLLYAINAAGDLPDTLPSSQAPKALGWGAYLGKALRGNQDSLTECVIKKLQNNPECLNNDEQFMTYVASIQNEEVNRQKDDSCFNFMSNAEEVALRTRIYQIAIQVKNYMGGSSQSALPREELVTDFNHYFHPKFS